MSCPKYENLTSEVMPNCPSELLTGGAGGLNSNKDELQEGHACPERRRKRERERGRGRGRGRDTYSRPRNSALVSRNRPEST